MKKAKLLLLLFSLMAVQLFGQQERGIIGSNNWLNGWSNFKPITFDYSDTNKIISTRITTDYTLSNANTYLLQGKIYVTNNATLTIEPGTVIRCETESISALIITKGSKIICNGTSNNPIVFTSNKAAGERKQDLARRRGGAVSSRQG